MSLRSPAQKGQSTASSAIRASRSTGKQNGPPTEVEEPLIGTPGLGFGGFRPFARLAVQLKRLFTSSMPLGSNLRFDPPRGPNEKPSAPYGARAFQRRRADSNRRMEVLQTSPLATWVPRLASEWELERAKGLEPSTFCLASRRSTAELRPPYTKLSWVAIRA